MSRRETFAQAVEREWLGIKEQFFFQKDTPDSYPSWLRTERIDSDHAGSINYVFAENRAGAIGGEPGRLRAKFRCGGRGKFGPNKKRE